MVFRKSKQYEHHFCFRLRKRGEMEAAIRASVYVAERWNFCLASYSRIRSRYSSPDSDAKYLRGKSHWTTRKNAGEREVCLVPRSRHLGKSRRTCKIKT